MIPQWTNGQTTGNLWKSKSKWPTNVKIHPWGSSSPSSNEITLYIQQTKLKIIKPISSHAIKKRVDIHQWMKKEVLNLLGEKKFPLTRLIPLFETYPMITDM